jgi:hypothetical protein
MWAGEACLDLPAHMIWNRFSFSNFLNTAANEWTFSIDAAFHQRVPLTAFDLDKLIADEQGQKSVVIGIHCDVQRYQLVKVDERVDIYGGR